ncbi:transposase [Streptomyces niveus]|uniref:transposase n=1 Tax=Streptomyces niveus TaxID=193462 RepID=UPI003866BAC1
MALFRRSFLITPSPLVQPEFKAQIVELRRRGDHTIGQVARGFGPTESTVRLWVNQAQVDVGDKDGLTSAERDAPHVPVIRSRQHSARQQAASSLATSGTGPPEPSSYPSVHRPDPPSPSGRHAKVRSGQSNRIQHSS